MVRGTVAGAGGGGTGATDVLVVDDRLLLSGVLVLVGVVASPGLLLEVCSYWGLVLFLS
jgi:hypothetical protein